VQKAPRLVRARAGWGRRWWEGLVVLTLGMLVVPLTAALTAAEDAPALAATAGAALAADSAAVGVSHGPGMPGPGASPGSATPTPAAARAPSPGPATPPASAAPAAEAPPVQTVVGLGDSVPAGSACGCTDYVSLLARQLGAKVTSTNLAVPGQTTSGLLDQLSSAQVRTALAGADVVVVTIGANDVEGTDPSDCDGDDGPTCYKDDLAALTGNLDRIATAVARLTTRPGARVLLTGYWNVFLDGAVARSQGASYVKIADAVTREVNSRISSAASAHGAVFVDLFTPFRGADGSKDCTALLASDGDHPDAAGHVLIARTLLAAL
jgi:lysophospholipase L1-like esterase